ncbi:MAG TPA: hypothetical protein VKZ63_16030 [Kofleriaceae bacterium]|nr:hypothetical protein [Kofleriaceae bacterium]
MSRSKEDRRALRGRRRMLAPAALLALLSGAEPDAEAAALRGAAGHDLEAAEAAAGWAVSEPHLRALAQDPDPDRRMSLAAVLPAALDWLPPIEQVELVAGWSSSPSPHLRLAIARALRLARPITGSISAIELLAGDRDPDVRVAIAQAAWLRRKEAPARLIAILHRLAGDPHRHVREVARLALGDA